MRVQRATLLHGPQKLFPWNGGSAFIERRQVDGLQLPAWHAFLMATNEPWKFFGPHHFWHGLNGSLHP
jgi:hypothetical protein